MGSLDGFGQVGWVRTGIELRSLSGKIQVQIEFPTGSHKAEISPIAKQFPQAIIDCYILVLAWCRG